MIAVVTGMIASYPLGGVFWDYVQYALGLEQLGFDVWYLEDVPMAPYDPATGDYDFDDDGGRSAAYLGGVLGAVSSDLGRRWHLRNHDGHRWGVPADELMAIIADADVFLNVSGAAPLRDEYLACRRKVLIDTDPGWNHFMRWPRWDAERPTGDHGYRAHDWFFTYAERLGRPDCALPDLGLEWRPTRPPVVSSLWATPEGPPANGCWTTVLSWDNAPLPITDGTRSYGAKERELPRIEALPARTRCRLEIAAGGVHPPVERWRKLGWSVVDAPTVSATPEDYRAYIRGSRGELSVAKNVYVATRSGWFSCRTVCYLAAGRPAVVQDTGCSELLATGEGLLAFDDIDQAAAALETVEAAYEDHAHAARWLAAERFGAERVLTELLYRTEVNV